MKEEQLNLYGDNLERFKVKGRTPEDLEKEARENTLEGKVRKFIAKKEKERTIKKEKEIDVNQIIDLVNEFIGEPKEEDFFEVKKILIAELLEDYSLTSAVMRAEVENKNGSLFKPETKKDSIIKTESGPELDREEIKKLRAKAPYSHRSMPDRDFE
jgi:hypothetical protein